jgi:hypothetical protein
MPFGVWAFRWCSSLVSTMFTSTNRNFVGLTLEADACTVRQYSLVVELSYSPALHDWLAGAGIEFLFEPNPPARWQAPGMVAYHLVSPPQGLIEVLKMRHCKILNMEVTKQLPRYRGE